jgi:uncharacterized membrane protein YfcA
LRLFLFGPERAINFTLICVLLIIFLAILIRSAIGFGDALVGIPLLALCIPLRQAVPFSMLLSIVIAVIILAQDWRQMRLRTAAGLLVPMVVGMPLGLLLLVSRHDVAAKVVLALMIVSFAGYSFFWGNRLQLRSNYRGWMLAFGFCSGVLAGAFGMGGPPVAIYGSLRRWPPAEFRATLQGYFLPASILIMVGYWKAGLWVPAVTRYFLLSLPVAVVAAVLGRALNRRLSSEAFLRCVYVALGGIGIMLMFQAVTGHA